MPIAKMFNIGGGTIILSSKAHLYSKIPLIPLNVEEKDYNRYYRSKLATTMYAQYLSKKLANKGIIMASVHLGVVRTEISRNDKFSSVFFFDLGRPFTKNPWQGAQTTLYCVLTPDLISGAYYADCAVAKPNPLILDEKAQEELISASLEAVGL